MKIKTPPATDAYRDGWDRIWEDDLGEEIDTGGHSPPVYGGRPIGGFSVPMGLE